MATPLLGLYAPSDGSDTGAWGHNFVNGLATTLDNIIASVQTITVTGGTVSINSAQANAQMLQITGTLTSNVTINNGSLLWNGIRCVENLTTGAFTVSLSQSGTSVAIAQNARFMVFLDPVSGVRLVGQLSTTQQPDVPSGTVASFYQNAAPAGWTISSTLNDYGLRIVTGTGGATSGGSTKYSTAFGQSTTGAYTLQIADIPSHTHPFTGIVIGGGGNFSLSPGSANNPTGVVGNTGGGGPHVHGFNLGVRTADFILATKN